MQDRKTLRRNRIEMKYNFALQVRQMREAAGLSIKELAAQIFVSENSVRQLELGGIHDWGMIFAIAQFFDKKIRIEFY